MREIYSETARRFRIPGKIASVTRTGNGSIHHTYRVTLENGEEYIFQKINTAVFKNPAEIMENIARVTAHIRGKCGGRPCLSFLCTESGENYTVIGEEYWRVSPYIDSVTIAPDACLAPEVIRGTGEAFGEFQRQLADFDGSVLHGTIPDFHDTRKRLDTLFADAAAYARTQSTRISDTVRELARLRAYYKEAIVLSDRYRAGEFPDGGGGYMGGSRCTFPEIASRARQGPHGSNGQPKDTSNAAAEVVWNAGSASSSNCTRNVSKNRLSLTVKPAEGQSYP